MLPNNNGLFRFDSIEFERQQRINAEIEYTKYVKI